MEILQLDGMDPQLFTLIGPLAMNPKVLKANNNYPFKTTEHFQWYIAIEKGNIMGFLPIEKKRNSQIINNYYIHNDNTEILEILLESVNPQDNLYAVVQIKHEPAFTARGFKVEHRWTNYVKMTYNTDKKDE